MKKSLASILGLHLCLLASCRSVPPQTELSSDGDRPLVFIMAGQSNMAGQTPMDEVMKQVWVDGVEIFCVHHYKFASDREEYRPDQEPARWESLKACGASPDGFGPELTFAQELRKRYPKRKIHLIKYAHGGTSLACEWQPNPPSAAYSTYGEPACLDYIRKNSWKTQDSLRTYQRFLTAVRWGRESLKARGLSAEISAMLWFQGEADAEGRASFRFLSETYTQNLPFFVDSVRRDLAVPEMPFVLGKIKCGYSSAEWDRALNPLEKIRGEQQKFADAEAQVYAFDTMDLSFQADNCHYDTESMKVIGRRFAEQMPNL